MINDLKDFDRLVQIMETISYEGQAKVFWYALEVQEKEKLEKQTLLKGKQIIEWDIESQLNESMRNIANFGKMCKELDGLHLAALRLKMNELAGKSLTHETITTYELVRKQTEILMQEYFNTRLPGVSYDEALDLMKKLSNNSTKVTR